MLRSKSRISDTGLTRCQVQFEYIRSSTEAIDKRGFAFAQVKFAASPSTVVPPQSVLSSILLPQGQLRQESDPARCLLCNIQVIEAKDIELIDIRILLWTNLPEKQLPATSSASPCHGLS